MAITCGNKARHDGGTGTHDTVDLVRRCYLDPETFTCGWQYLIPAHFDPRAEDFVDERVAECDGLAWTVPDGIVCENGHEHFFNREYTDDPDEAAALMKVGVAPLDMAGRAWI